MAGDTDAPAPLRAWRALIRRWDASGNPAAPTPGFVLDSGRSREPVLAELRRELPAEVRDDLRDYAIIDESGKIAKKLAVTTWSVDEDLGASVFGVLNGALRQLSITLVFSTTTRVSRSEEIVAEDLQEIAADHHSTLAFLRGALELDRQALAEGEERQRRVAAERLQAIPGSLDDHGMGEDFHRAQSLLCRRVGAYGDATERDLLGTLARFGALCRFLRDPGGSVPAAFAAAADAFVIACRLAAFDRTFVNRDLTPPPQFEGLQARFPDRADAQARGLETALGALERDLLRHAEWQDGNDAHLNAARYWRAAEYVSRSRALLQTCLSTPTG